MSYRIRTQGVAGADWLDTATHLPLEQLLEVVRIRFHDGCAAVRLERRVDLLDYRLVVELTRQGSAVGAPAVPLRQRERPAS